MARRDPAPVWFQTRPSKRLILYLLAAHGLAGVALWLAVLPAWLTIALGLGVTASLIDGLRVHALRRGRRAVSAVHWWVDGHWRVLDGTGDAGSYTAHEAVIVHPALVLVRLTAPGRRRWLLLAGDSGDQDTMRRLRVRLRRAIGRQGDAQAGPPAGT